MSELEQVFDQTLEAFKQRLHISPSEYSSGVYPQFFLDEGRVLVIAQFANNRLFPTKESLLQSAYPWEKQDWLWAEAAQIRRWSGEERYSELYILARWEDTRNPLDQQGQRPSYRHFIYRKSESSGLDELTQRYLVLGELEHPNLLGLPWDSSFRELPAGTELLPENPQEQPRALLASLLRAPFKRRPISADLYERWVEEAHKQQRQHLRYLLDSIPKWQSLRSLARKSSSYDELQNQESEAARAIERPAPIPHDDVDRAIRIEEKEGAVLPGRVILEGPAIQWLLGQWAHDIHEDINPSVSRPVSYGPYAHVELMSSMSIDSARSTRLSVLGDLLRRFGVGGEMDRIEQAEKAEAEKRRIAAEE